MNHSVNIALLIALIAMLLGAVSFLRQPAGTSNEESALDNIRERGTIDACYISFVPYSFQSIESGKMEGIGVDVIEGIANKMNTKVRYVETTWGNLVLDLKSGRCQVNISGPFPLIERANGGVMFTKAIGFNGNNGVVKKGDTRFKSLEDLNKKGVKIAVVEGEQGHIYAKKYLPNAELRVISSGDTSLALAEVSAGRADAGLGDAITVELYLRKHDDVEFLLDKDYLLRGATFAVNEDEIKLLNFLNNAIDVMAVSGELKNIFKKYDFKSIIPRNSVAQCNTD